VTHELNRHTAELQWLTTEGKDDRTTVGRIADLNDQVNALKRVNEASSTAAWVTPRDPPRKLMSSPEMAQRLVKPLFIRPKRTA